MGAITDQYTLVCVGGPLCGQVRTCNQKWFDHVETPEPANFASRDGAAITTQAGHKRTRYVKRQPYFNQPLAVWAPEEITPYETVEILIRAHAERGRHEK